MDKDNNYPKTIMLIQNSFTTILLDAIQFYPQESIKHKAESHGLLFGNIKNEILECDYIFPVGNVSYRKSDEIKNNPKVDKAIQNAKHLLFTSRLCGTYHSHPNTLNFKEWAYPSNMDILYAKGLKQPYMIIIAISRNALLEKRLSLECLSRASTEYHYDKNAGDHDFPREVTHEGQTIYFTGKFKRYKFEMRAYKYENNYLRDINLVSSEAEMLMELSKNDIAVEDLSSETSYGLRKIEYDFRALRINDDRNYERAKQNLEYHIQRLKDKK